MFSPETVPQSQRSAANSSRDDHLEEAILRHGVSAVRLWNVVQQAGSSNTFYSHSLYDTNTDKRRSIEVQRHDNQYSVDNYSHRQCLSSYSPAQVMT